MLRSLHISRTGLDAQQTQLDVISNNLANVSTTGFKKARAVFEDLLYQIIRQPGAQSSQQTQLPSGFPVGRGRADRGHRAHLHPGQPATDRERPGRGHQRARLLPGPVARRQHAYTRDGSFQVDSQGNIVTASGYAVLPNMQVPQDALVVSIARMAWSA
jgi:flagellar basal-body rod protein FlgG